MNGPDATTAEPGTLRQRQKADRRALLLREAKRLIAQQGYLGVRLEDIGRAAGVTGPAVYRHFPSKNAVLVELLVGISEHLLDGGERLRRQSGTPAELLRQLIDWHVDFAISEPELILIYDRDRHQLPAEALRAVRRTQRRYVEIWAEAVGAARSSADPDLDRTSIHAVLGLINAIPRVPHGVPRNQVREAVSAMALRALELSPR